MKKHLQDIIGAITGGVTGFISSGFYETWIQPMILAAVCALIGLLITHYGRRLLNSFDNWRVIRKLGKYRDNGKDEK